MDAVLPWTAPLLFALSTGGFAFVIVRAFIAGLEASNKAYSEATARELEDIFLFIPPKKIEEIRWAGAGVFFIILFLMTGSLYTPSGAAAGLACGLAGAAIAMLLPGWVLAILKARRLARFNSQLVDTLVGMSNSLKAGFSISQAFESVVKDGMKPISQEFDVFLQQTRIGVGFSEALSNMDERVGSQDLTLVVMAMETARKTGGNLTEILEAISKTIRERMRIENRIRTLTAQGRLQGIIVGAMPLAIGAIMLILDPDTMKPFLHSTTGLVIIFCTAVLVACGGLMIRKIIKIDV